MATAISKRAAPLGAAYEGVSRISMLPHQMALLRSYRVLLRSYYKDLAPTEPYSTGCYDLRSNARRAPKKIKTPPVIRLSTVLVLG
jgi:hypothetical protein